MHVATQLTGNILRILVGFLAMFVFNNVLKYIIYIFMQYFLFFLNATTWRDRERHPSLV